MKKQQKNIKFTLGKKLFQIFLNLKKNDNFFQNQNTQVVISYDKGHCYFNYPCEYNDIISISMNKKSKEHEF
jgi:hypothetical protein